MKELTLTELRRVAPTAADIALKPFRSLFANLPGC
jgi:hypothetical protein